MCTCMSLLSKGSHVQMQMLFLISSYLFFAKSKGRADRHQQNYPKEVHLDLDDVRDSKSGERGEHARAIFLPLLC